MATFHVDSIQNWQSFEHDGVIYDLRHLSAHGVIFKAAAQEYEFVVTYGLHCFTKDGSDANIPYRYEDGRHGQLVCLERYEASKQLKTLVQNLSASILYRTDGERFFTVSVLNSASGLVEPYKVCLAFYREHRLLRIHVTSAYFARTGEGSPDAPITRKGFSVFKVAMDTQRKPKGQCPKEVRNRPKPQK